MKIVFAGGGTGGHLYPAIALAQVLREHNSVDFVGSADRLEARIVPKAGFRLHVVQSRPLVRKPLVEFIRTVVSNTIGIAQSVLVIARLQPDMLIATGGYVSFPVVTAARILRILRFFRGVMVLFEPNAQPGLTNRMLAPHVNEVWGAYAHVDLHFVGKYVHTGTPVRASLRNPPRRTAALTNLGLAMNRKTLLAMGGSQGARTINDALVALLASDGLPPGWQVIHVTGEREYDRVRHTLAGRCVGTIHPYLDDMSEAYAAADLVLARAGASTLAELAALGLPAILVPYPHAAEDHQQRNAEMVRDAGAAEIATDRELQAGALGMLLAEITQPERLEALRSAATSARSADPLALMLARIEALVTRKTSP